MSRNISKDVLKSVNKKSGKQVTPKQIQKVASGVKPSTMQNEKQLRQLIKQVSKMANVPVSESTTKEIVQAVKKRGNKSKKIEGNIKIKFGKKGKKTE